MNLMEGELLFVEKVPNRGPFSPLDELSGFFRNKKIYDLGCGSGDIAVYIKKKFNPISIKGISFKRERFAKQKERYNMNFICGDIEKVKYEKEDIDTYFIWIENPDVEIKVIEKNIDAKKNTIIIIAYNTKVNCKYNQDLKTNYNPNCRFCKYIACIPEKINKLRNFLSSKKIGFIEKVIEYNDGDECRQKGLFTYFIIQL